MDSALRLDLGLDINDLRFDLRLVTTCLRLDVKERLAYISANSRSIRTVPGDDLKIKLGAKMFYQT